MDSVHIKKLLDNLTKIKGAKASFFFAVTLFMYKYDKYIQS